MPSLLPILALTTLVFAAFSHALALTLALTRPSLCLPLSLPCVTW